MMNSINRRMMELYNHPDNAKRTGCFTESFIGACLLHPNDLEKTMSVVNKFNQRLEEPITKQEQDLLLKKLEERLSDEFSTN